MRQISTEDNARETPRQECGERGNDYGRCVARGAVGHKASGREERREPEPRQANRHRKPDRLQQPPLDALVLALEPATNERRGEEGGEEKEVMVKSVVIPEVNRCGP